MGGKNEKQSSTGLTPMMKSSRIRHKTPDDENKENIDPTLRRSARAKANRNLFTPPRTFRSVSKPRGSISPQKNSPRKRTASTKRDKSREDAVSPAKKSPARPRRNASAIAAAKITDYNDDATPPQPPRRQRKAVLEVDNVDVTRRRSPTKLKTTTNGNFSTRAGWNRHTTPDDDSDNDNEEWTGSRAPPATSATPRRSERRTTKMEEISPSKQLDVFSKMTLRSPAKGQSRRESKSPTRTLLARAATPGRTTVSTHTPEKRVTADAKKLSYTPLEKIELKMTLRKMDGETWRKRSLQTPKIAGTKTPVRARVVREERDVSYEPTADDSSESEEEKSEKSEESEEERHEEKRRRKGRQRRGRGKGGKGLAAAVARNGSAAGDGRKEQGRRYKMEVDKEDEVTEQMEVGDAPSSLETALDRLAVYRCPRGTLLCREVECAQIKEFIKTAIAPDGISQACYISGVPGTGKTASVMAMVKELGSSKGCPPFVFLGVNAMYYSDPKQVFSEILYEYEKKIKGEGEKIRRLSGSAARKRLNALFECVDRQRPPVLLLVDELDQLSTKKQELIYDVFNWSAVEGARVSIISIANTLDLPERMLNQRICSRLGMNRIVFQPYTHAEIERIVLAKLGGTKDSDREDAIIDAQVVEIAARKVAAISGDLRKATDILRAAIEAAMRKGEKRLTFDEVKEAIRAASETLLVLAVRSLSKHQMFVFDAAVDIVRTRDVFDFTMDDLVKKYESITMLVYNETPLNYYAVVRILFQLSSLGLIKFCNPNERAIFRRRLRLLPAVHDASSALKIVTQKRNPATVLPRA